MLDQLVGLFPGIHTLFMVSGVMAFGRIFLILLGGFLLYLGYKEILDPLLMVPMGFAMCMVNAGMLILPGAGGVGNLFLSPLTSKVGELMQALQVYFLQPIYTFTFTNGLIACLVFMGIGVITDVDFLIARPMLSFFLAVMAELGTILTLPIAVACGFHFNQAAAIASVGGADGPIVLYASLMLAKELFVPITVVAYVYLSVAYAVYPYIIKMMIPRSLRGITMEEQELPVISPAQKFAFAVVAGIVLCLLFPVAAPLIASFFFGVGVKETAPLKRFQVFLNDVVLSGSTVFLGFTLGALLSVDIIFSKSVFLVMFLGMVALILSAVGGLVGGLIVTYFSKKTINPLVGIAAVSCIPTTAKVAQKCAMEVEPEAMILPHCIGPSVAGVITTAIICSCYISYGLLH